MFYAIIDFPGTKTEVSKHGTPRGCWAEIARYLSETYLISFSSEIMDQIVQAAFTQSVGEIYGEETDLETVCTLSVVPESEIDDYIL